LSEWEGWDARVEQQIGMWDGAGEPFEHGCVAHLELCGPSTRVHCLNSPPHLQVATKTDTESARARMICLQLASTGLETELDFMDRSATPV